MKIRLAIVASTAAALAMGVATPVQAAPDTMKKAERWIKRIDTNEDSRVDMEEWAAYRTMMVEEKGKDAKMAEPKRVERSFKKKDANSDGFITAEEVLDDGEE